MLSHKSTENRRDSTLNKHRLSRLSQGTASVNTSQCSCGFNSKHSGLCHQNYSGVLTFGGYYHSWLYPWKKPQETQPQETHLDTSKKARKNPALRSRWCEWGLCNSASSEGSETGWSWAPRIPNMLWMTVNNNISYIIIYSYIYIYILYSIYRDITLTWYWIYTYTYIYIYIYIYTYIHIYIYIYTYIYARFSGHIKLGLSSTPSLTHRKTVKPWAQDAPGNLDPLRFYLCRIFFQQKTLGFFDLGQELVLVHRSKRLVASQKDSVKGRPQFHTGWCPTVTFVGLYTPLTIVTSTTNHSYAGWWFGTWILWLSIQLGSCHHPNWLSHIFQRVGIPPTSYGSFGFYHTFPTLHRLGCRPPRFFQGHWSAVQTTCGAVRFQGLKGNTITPEISHNQWPFQESLVPSGKHTKNYYGKSQFLMGQLTINDHFQ